MMAEPLLEVVYLRTEQVLDPDSGGMVGLDCCQDPYNGSIFAIDGSFLEFTGSTGICSPYTEQRMLLPDSGDACDEQEPDTASIDNEAEAVSLGLIEVDGARLHVFKDPESKGMFALDLGLLAGDKIRSPFNQHTLLDLTGILKKEASHGL